MGWAVGYDQARKRDVGYGVPARCDFPGCFAEIDRGLGYRCGGTWNLDYGDEIGCGLFFCAEHLKYRTYDELDHEHDDRPLSAQVCQRCFHDDPPFDEWSPDTPDWCAHKLIDESWQEWCDQNPDEVAKARPIAATALEPLFAAMAAAAG